MDQNGFCYPGDELALFAHATRWKRYWSRAVSPYLGARVLEVGAGIGTNTALLYSGNHKEWVCLEPDAKMVEVIRERQRARRIPASCEIRCGTLADIEDHRRFDTILYIDVLEHIEGDQHEVVQAAGRLAVHGRLVVLAPSYQWLFSPFDAAVGHCRRYEILMPLAWWPRWRTRSCCELPCQPSGRSRRGIS